MGYRDAIDVYHLLFLIVHAIGRTEKVNFHISMLAIL